MKLVCLTIGKSTPEFVAEGVREYSKRIGKYASFEWNLLSPVKNAAKLPVQELKKREGEAFMKVIQDKDFVLLLDEKGKTYSSRSYARYIQQLEHRSIKRLVFVIGGAYGFSNEIYDRGNSRLRLSDMTFSHQLIRVIFVEQLYRAYSILHNDPYHND